MLRGYLDRCHGNGPGCTGTARATLAQEGPGRSSLTVIRQHAVETVNNSSIEQQARAIAVRQGSVEIVSVTTTNGNHPMTMGVGEAVRAIQAGAWFWLPVQQRICHAGAGHRLSGGEGARNTGRGVVEDFMAQIYADRRAVLGVANQQAAPIQTKRVAHTITSQDVSDVLCDGCGALGHCLS